MRNLREQQTLSANRNQPALWLLITSNEIISASFDKVEASSVVEEEDEELLLDAFPFSEGYLMLEVWRITRIV